MAILGLEPPQLEGESSKLISWVHRLYDWVVGTKWYTPTLLNSWVDLGGEYQGARYRKVGGIVELQGLIKDGTTTNGTTLFTLPQGYRPTKRLIFISVQYQADPYDVLIYPDGSVIINYVTTSVWLSLSGIFFKAEQ
jgi:hypothetical protein